LVESWRNLQSANIELTMKRLRDLDRGMKEDMHESDPRRSDDRVTERASVRTAGRGS
jgi:hypothetical protein